MKRWRGTTALVTGASQGIGAAVTIALLEHGVNVIGCARETNFIEALNDRISTEDRGTLTAIRCDLRDEQQILQMFEDIKEKCTQLHILVNCAGLSVNAPLLSANTEDWREMIDVNIIALSICTREAFKLMKKEGHIINICSMSAHRAINNKANHFYSATKMMVKSLTEGIRCELRSTRSNIRISQISPGIVDTEFFIRLGGEELHKKISKIKILQAEDIAESIIYVLSAPAHLQVHDILMRPTAQVM